MWLSEANRSGSLRAAGDTRKLLGWASKERALRSECERGVSRTRWQRRLEPPVHLPGSGSQRAERTVGTASRGGAFRL